MTETTAIAKVGEVDARPHRLCRVGTFLWILPESIAIAKAKMPSNIKHLLVEKMCELLEGDTRVIEVRKPEINEAFTGRKAFFPESRHTTSDGIRTGNDKLEAMSLSDDIRFRIKVPIKNQPKHHGYDDIPTDEYWVSWDGVTVFVLWEQDTEHDPMSGGHILADILRDAAQELGGDIYIQACSPGCDNLFFHTTMHISETPAEEETRDIVITKRPRSPIVDVSLYDIDDAFEALMWLHLCLSVPCGRFAEMKNLGQRLIDIEHNAGRGLAHLLDHYYEHSRLSTLPPWREIRNRWKNRSWRKEVRYLLVGLWLSLANMETVRQGWADAQRGFENTIDEDGKAYLFAIDYRDDAAAIESINTRSLETAIEQVSDRLDNRTMVAVTFVGGVAGGLAGALVGLFH